MLVAINEITIGENRRKTDMQKINQLAESINQIGLLNPVTITTEFKLIAGLHRLEAYKSMGKEEIECNVVDLYGLIAELAEIDENLMRNELHFIDRGDSLGRRKEIYEELFPDTRHGMRNGQTSKDAESAALETPSFAVDTSTKAGISTRVIHEELQISKNILPEVKEIIKDNDISKTDCLKIARLEPEQQKVVAKKIESKEAKSFIDAIRIIKSENVKEVKPIDGKYRVVYADPPWSYGDKLVDGYGAAENHYPTMSIKELCDMPIKNITEDNAVLFLWVTSPLLEDSFQLINAWGFKYKTSFVWDKIKHNMGHYNSVRHELLLICTRGSCLPDINKLFDSVVSIERTAHSEKPEVFRETIETLYTHGNKIELFSRKQNDGWTVWGNQCD